MSPLRAEISSRAPGRLELLGNHTDYNQGLVLGAAIDRGVSLNGESRRDQIIELRSTEFGEWSGSLSQLKPNDKERWTNYVVGVVQQLQQRGLVEHGFSVEIASDLPPGQGLSSSAALEVATALFLLKLREVSLPVLEVAKICQRAEHEFVGVKSGLLDQVTSLFGRADHLVFFDCRSEEVQAIPFPRDLALIVSQSAQKRELRTAPYNLRRTETAAAAESLGVTSLRDVSSEQVNASATLPQLLRRRALHITGENERVQRAVNCLQRGDGAGFGALLYESHRSSQEYFENSTPDLDRLVELARSVPGILGARLTGAGFGGATVTLCRGEAAEAAMSELKTRFLAQTGQTVNAFVCRVADGAR